MQTRGRRPIELPHGGCVEGALGGELHPPSMEPQQGGVLPVAVHDAWAAMGLGWDLNKTSAVP